MKKIILILLINVFIFGDSFLISDIPLPRTYIMDLDPYDCNEECLREYLRNDMIFSFLATTTFKKDINDEYIKEAKNIYISILNLSSTIHTDKLKIAMLLPYKKIGKYATSTTNAVFAYLLARNYTFELKSFKIESESKEDIKKALEEIKNDGFLHVIAPLTIKGALNLTSLSPELAVWFPTINKKDISSSSKNIYFGAIDYEEQSKELLKEASNKLVIFYDKSYMGQKLKNLQEEIFLTNSLDFDTLLTKPKDYNNKKIIKFSIASRTTNLERELKNNLNIIDSSVFLDTPLVKSGMIMSQLTLYDINTTNKLSTQINYDPLIFSITQYKDRKNMIIANSITKQNNVFIQANALLSNDIKYDWINYTTTVGIDMFFSDITSLPREYKIPIVENQAIYPIELKEPAYSKFKNHHRKLREEIIY